MTIYNIIDLFIIEKIAKFSKKILYTKTKVNQFL